MKKAMIVVAVLIVVGFLCLQYAATEVYNWDRDEANQERIGDAYAAYYKGQKQFPTSLADLVSKGYLPSKGRFYREPPGMLNLERSFEESSYQVLAPESGDVRNLKMIARKKSDGSWQFEPTANAYTRDRVLGFDFMRDRNRSPDYIKSKIGGNGTEGQPATTQH